RNNKAEIKDEEVDPTPKNLSAVQLFGVGVVSCLAELTSALPCIGYLTVLISADNQWTVALVMLVLYNLVLFNLPLYILYAVSVYNEKYLMKIYARFYCIMSYILEYGIPVLNVLLSLFHIFRRG